LEGYKLSFPPIILLSTTLRQARGSEVDDFQLLHQLPTSQQQTQNNPNPKQNLQHKEQEKMITHHKLSSTT